MECAAEIDMTRRLRGGRHNDCSILMAERFAGDRRWIERSSFMEETNASAWKLKPKWMRYCAGVVALVWAAFWSFFGLASGIGEGLSPMAVLVHTTLPGLIFVASAVAAWRTHLIGAVVLLIEGLVILIGYSVMTYHNFPSSTIVFVILTMALPPIFASFLFISSSTLNQRGLRLFPH